VKQFLKVFKDNQYVNVAWICEIMKFMSIS